MYIRFANLTPNPHSPKKYALIRPFEGTPLWNYPSWFVFAMPMPLFCARSVVPIRCVPHPRNWVWTCRRSSKAFFQPTCSLRKRRISEKSCWNCLWSRKRLGVSPTLSVLDSTFVYTVYIYIYTMTDSTGQTKSSISTSHWDVFLTFGSFSSFNFVHTQDGLNWNVLKL